MRALPMIAMTGLLALSQSGLAASAEVDPLANPPTPAFEGQTGAPAPERASRINVEVLAGGLYRPRALVALPNGDLLVADGAGDLRIVKTVGGISEPIPGMPTVRSAGGRGFQDISPAVDIAQSRQIFMAYPAPPPGETEGEVSMERRNAASTSGELFQVDTIAVATLNENFSGIEKVEHIAELPGRRLVQAPDGTLYISTMGFGLAFVEHREAVQRLDSPLGKMLRINADGSIPNDNPFSGRSLVRQDIYSWGHRDPDGMMIHPDTGELWTIEHGPMGGDELNRILPGRNYGWPYVTYGKNYDGTEIGPSDRTGVEQPRYYFFPSRALSGLMKYTGSLFPEWQGDIFIGAMSPTQGKFLVRLDMDGDKVISEEHLLVERDRRVRDVVQGIDGAVYVLTDSEDSPDTGRVFDGEVLRLTPR